MTVSEAIRVARIVLHGIRVKEQVTDRQIAKAYDVLAEVHQSIDKLGKIY